MVERGALEKRCPAFGGTGGSNPPPTASKFSQSENLLPNYKLLTQITKLSLPENSREARIFSN